MRITSATKRDGKPTRRAIEIAMARQAGHENDPKEFTRILIERRATSHEALRDAYNAGANARLNQGEG
jgi:hypothetical protein